MNTQPEALRLAEWIEDDMSCDGDAEIAAELRRQFEEIKRLHALNAELLEALKKTTREMARFSAKDVCDAAHHHKIDQHGVFSKCPVAERFLDVYNHAQAAIAKAEGEQA